MQTLFLLRGAPASGKSTFIEKNHLEPYTLCADKIRTQVSSPILNTQGDFTITQHQDKYVWETLYTMLEKRMQDGCLTFIDATHYKSSLISPYKKLVEKYRYRVFIIDFTDVPYEELIRRNNLREEYKRVPEAVIKKMTTCFNGDSEVRKWCTIIKPEEFKEIIKTKPLDITDSYKAVNFIGDIHGCYTALMDYFVKHPFKEDELYIFLGDYTDRGLENKEIVSWLLENYKRKNIWLLKSNHTIHLENFANEEVVRSREFNNNTAKQLETFDKKDLRQLCRKFIQMAYISFKGKNYLATHGGICLKDLTKLQYVPTKQFMNGVGQYSDSDIVDKMFSDLVQDCYSVHGHRNINKVPMHNTPFTFNLDSTIEYGEPLKILRVTDTFEEIKIANRVFSPKPIIQETLPFKTDNELVNSLIENKNIIKKDLGDNYYSFNFSRDVFYKKQWNELTNVARGLFVHLPDCKIVARSYRKFFNIDERPETKLDVLTHNIEYPVQVYHKYNGFLGLLSYDFVKDDFFIATKSTNQGDYKNWFKQILKEKKVLTYDLKEYLKTNNVTFIFEVIDPFNDPHIIKYSQRFSVLLDIIYNQFEFKKYSYNDLTRISNKFNFISKQRLFIAGNKEELLYYLKELDKMHYLEGAVFEDNKGYMFKYKTPLYRFWKEMRGLKDKFAKGQTPAKIYKDDKWISFYKFLEKLPKETLKKDIITLREIYEEQNK